MECPLIDLANVPQDQRYGSTENGKTKQMEEGSSEGCGNLQKTNTSGQGAASKCGMGFVGFVAVAILALGIASFVLELFQKKYSVKVIGTTGGFYAAMLLFSAFFSIYMSQNWREWARLFFSLLVIGVDAAAVHYGICIYFLPTEEYDKTQYRRVAWAFLLRLFSVALSLRCVGVISETLSSGDISFSLLLQWIFGKTKDAKGIKYWPSSVKFYIPRKEKGSTKPHLVISGDNPRLLTLAKKEGETNGQTLITLHYREIDELVLVHWCLFCILLLLLYTAAIQFLYAGIAKVKYVQSPATCASGYQCFRSLGEILIGEGNQTEERCLKGYNGTSRGYLVCVQLRIYDLGSAAGLLEGLGIGWAVFKVVKQAYPITFVVLSWIANVINKKWYGKIEPKKSPTNLLGWILLSFCIIILVILVVLAVFTYLPAASNYLLSYWNFVFKLLFLLCWV
eukprot:m.207238 g.207238  ORF g.207238 m.207238 type:complete len:452 (+) comp39694_c0_seq6:168-1523(+)